MLTARQRLGLGMISLGVLGWLALGRFNRPVYLSDPSAERGERASELTGRVDPNTADWPTLAALPAIGPSLAKRIVEDRERFSAEHPGRRAYAGIDDLLRIKGVGPATLKNLEPYLIFTQGEAGTTSPAWGR
jgi:competence protein ComEA